MESHGYEKPSGEDQGVFVNNLVSMESEIRRIRSAFGDEVQLDQLSEAIRGLKDSVSYKVAFLHQELVQRDATILQLRNQLVQYSDYHVVKDRLQRLERQLQQRPTESSDSASDYSGRSNLTTAEPILAIDDPNGRNRAHGHSNWLLGNSDQSSYHAQCLTLSQLASLPAAAAAASAAAAYWRQFGGASAAVPAIASPPPAGSAAAAAVADDSSEMACSDAGRAVSKLSVSPPSTEPLANGNATATPSPVLDEPLDTIRIAGEIRDLLTTHSIGQRLFARQILGLSQGTVSELLSKPKPWDKLTEKGRESYRKMCSWAACVNNVRALKALMPSKRAAAAAALSFGHDSTPAAQASCQRQHASLPPESEKISHMYDIVRGTKTAVNVNKDHRKQTRKISRQQCKSSQGLEQSYLTNHCQDHSDLRHAATGTNMNSVRPIASATSDESSITKGIVRRIYYEQLSKSADQADLTGDHETARRLREEASQLEANFPELTAVKQLVSEDRSSPLRNSSASGLGQPSAPIPQPIPQDQLDQFVEINTEELVREVKDLLAHFSISQRIFGERVLGLSQGSVSDLLSRPKPWPLLTQKGREPFIRMRLFVDDSPAVDRLVLIASASSESAAASDLSEQQLLPIKLSCDKPTDQRELSPVKRRHTTDVAHHTPLQPPLAKKARYLFTDSQKNILLGEYTRDSYPSNERVEMLASQFGLPPKTVSNWFHNRRMRYKSQAQSAVSAQALPHHHQLHQPLHHSQQPVECLDLRLKPPALLESSSSANCYQQQQQLSVQVHHLSKRKSSKPMRLLNSSSSSSIGAVNEDELQ